MQKSHSWIVLSMLYLSLYSTSMLGTEMVQSYVLRCWIRSILPYVSYLSLNILVYVITCIYCNSQLIFAWGFLLELWIMHYGLLMGNINGYKLINKKSYMMTEIKVCQGFFFIWVYMENILTNNNWNFFSACLSAQC